MTTDEPTLSESVTTEPADLKPKKPTNRAPEGIRTLTVCRQNDEPAFQEKASSLRAADLPPVTL